MQNLKITFHFSSAVMMYRFTTIDSILLYVFFNNLRREKKIDGYIDTEDYLEEISKFILVKNKTISGSVGYITKDDDIDIRLHYCIVTKKIDPRNYIDKKGASYSNGAFKTNGGEFKACRFGLEALNLSSVYFYINGDKEKINSLLKDVHIIGKKGSIGYGMVKSYDMENIENDKSFMLNESTPSKPLACADWNIKTHKVAFLKQYPPLHSKNNKYGKVPCYLPTTSLIEVEDHTWRDGYKSITDVEYISPSEFAFNAVKSVVKKDEYKKHEKKHRCVVCGKEFDMGIMGVRQSFKSSSNDWGFISIGDFVCEYCDWSKSDQNLLGYMFINKDGYRHIQGKKALTLEELETAKLKQAGQLRVKAERIKLFSHFKEEQPPFLCVLKNTKNQQHVIFKSTVSISNAIVPIQFGNDTYFVDNELLLEAISEIKSIMAETGMKKSDLTGQEIIERSTPKTQDTAENRHILSKFYIKYDRAIRVLLNRIVFVE